MRLRTAISGMLLATSAVVATSTATTVNAADTTTIVTGDENPTPAQIAAVEPSSGWDIGRDPGNLAPFEFTNDEASISSGSLFVGPIGNDIKGNADKFISEYVLDIPADTFESISYDILVDTATPAADANEFFLNIYASLPTPLSWYDCRFDIVPTTASDSAFTTVSLAADDVPAFVRTNGGATCPTTISGLPAGSTLSFMSLNVGDTSANDQDVAGYFDNVVLAVGGDTETFDFEAAPAPVSGLFTTTDVIDDENPTAEETASFLPSSGWDIGRDPANLAPFEFTTDESSIGAGALYAGPIGNDINGNADKFITEYVLDIPTSAFESISYDILVDTATPAADANEFYLNIYTNMPGSTAFYECRWNVVPETATNTGFTTIGVSSGDTTAGPGLSVTERAGSTCPSSIGAMPAGSTISFVSLSVGDTSANDQNVAGYYDNVIIRAGGNIDVFDFEAPESTPTGNETTTEVIDDENPTAEETASFLPSSGWDIGRDPANLAPFEFTTDESSIGAGALYAGPIGNDINGNADKFITEYVLDIPTSAFESISYDILVDTATPAADANEFYLNIYTNMPGSTAFYECRFDIVPATALNDAFTTVEYLATDDANNVRERNITGPCPEKIAEMPAGSTISFVSLSVGDTSANDQNVAGYFDNVIIKTNGNTDTFDFEAPATPPSGLDTTRKVIEDESQTPEEAAAGIRSDGWDIGRDPANLAPFEFTTDESSIGAGALYAGPIGNDINGNADKFITEYVLDIPTSAFESISYDILVDTATPAADANEFYLNIYTNMPGSTAFYECRFDIVPATALNDAFTTVEYLATDDANNVRERNITGPCPEKIAEMPAGSTISFVSLSVGDTSANDQNVAGYFDNVIIKTNGNTDTFDFDVDEAPEFTEQPADIEIDTAPGGTDAEATFGLPAATDDLSVPTVECAPASGFAFPVGTTTVTCTATDSADQTDEVAFDVIVTAIDAPPTFTEQPDDIEAGTALGGTTAVVTFDLPAATDDVAAPTVECDPASGFAFPVGTTTVTCTATDSAGQTDEVTFDVTVFALAEIDAPPTFDATPQDLTVPTAPAEDSVIVEFATPTASDDDTGNPPTVVCDPASGTEFPVGDTVVTCTATDSATQTTEVSFTVTVTATPDSDLIAVDPARILETRSGDDKSTIDGEALGDGTVPAGEFIEVMVAGRGGVTDDAIGAVVNLAAVNPAARGFATLYPCTDEVPTAASLNVDSGVNISNATFVDLSDTGSVCLFTSTASDFALDVVGYMPSTSRLGLVDPARLLETRTAGQSTIDGRSEGDGPVAAGNVIEIQVSGRGGVDDGAVAAMVNIAAINPSDNGFVTLFPCDEDQPLASSLNYTTGSTISNATLVALSDDGVLCVFVDDTIDLALDVVGFVPAGTDVGTLVPTRLLETRTGDGLMTIDGESQGDGIVAGGTSIEVPIAGRSTVDDDAASVLVNLAAVNPSARGYATLYPCTEEPPVAASVNYSAGVTISNATLVDLSDDGSVCLFTSADAHFVIDAVGFVTPATI